MSHLTAKTAILIFYFYRERVGEERCTRHILFSSFFGKCLSLNYMQLIPFGRIQMKVLNGDLYH